MQEAIALTVQKHPELASFIYRHKAQEGELQSASIGERPQIAFELENILGSGVNKTLDNAESTLSITWLLDKKLIEARIKRAQMNKSQINIEKEIKVLDLAAHTASIFIKNLAQQQELKLASKAKEQAEALVKAVKERVSAGKASEIEALQAEALLHQRELEQEDIVHELKSSSYQLSKQWANREVYFTAKGNLDAIPAIKSFSEYSNILKTNAKLKVFANLQRVSESQIILEKIKSKPRWELSTGIRHLKSSDDFGFVAGFSIPLGKDKSISGRTQSLRAQQSEYAVQAEAFSLKLNSQVYVLLQEIIHSKHIIESLTKKIIPLLDKAENKSIHAYEIGKLNYLQLNSTKEKWLEAHKSLIDAYKLIHLQHIELQRLTGTSFTL